MGRTREATMLFAASGSGHVANPHPPSNRYSEYCTNETFGYLLCRSPSQQLSSQGVVLRGDYILLLSIVVAVAVGGAG